MDIFLDDLGQTSPQDDVVPVGMFGHLRAILQRIAALCRGEAHTGHSHTLINITNFGLLPYVSNKHYFVHRLKI